MRRDYLKIARAGIDEKLQDSGSDHVSICRECQQILGKAIGEIRLDLRGKSFRDTAEEIGFYKEDAPWIWGLYMFYQTLVKIEAARKFESPATFRTGLEARLEQAETFFKEHRCVCAYYYEGRTDMDDELFTRRDHYKGKDPVIDIRADRDLTRGATLLSLMRKNELLRDRLNSELLIVSGATPQRKLKFHGPQTALIEVLKAMHLKGSFGDVTFQYVMQWANEVFGIEINNHENTLDNMKERKDYTPYLTDLEKLLKDFFEGKKPPNARKKSYLG